MFQKNPIVKPFANLKNSERRKIIKSTIASYNLPEDVLSLEFVNEHLFPKVIQHAVFKSSPSNFRGSVYVDVQTGKAVWFDTRDSGRLIPTLYTLWKAPFLLPIVYTHMGVVDHLSNGANLMIRGCMPPFDGRAEKGVLVAVSVIERPKVMVAVGYCSMDLSKITEIADNTAGVAVSIVHVYKDKLYKLDGKLEEDVLPKNEDIDMPTSIEELEELRNAGGEKSEQVEDTAELVAESHIDSTFSLSTEEVDDFFVRSVLYSITQDKIDLPIDASIFMSAHILKNLPPVDSDLVNMKKTSWKKAHKFLKAMEKLDLVKLKGKGEDVIVVSVADKSNQRVAKFEPYRVKKHSSRPVKCSSSSVTVQQLYKPKSSTRELFNRLNMEYDRYYEEHELKELVADYIRQFRLAREQYPKLIRIDPTMSEMGVKGIKQTINSAERSGVFAMIIGKSSNFQQFYRIVKNGDNGEDNGRTSKMKKGSPPKITVLIEQVRGRRKIMTRISGLEKYYIQPEELASVLKVKCSGSATIGEKPVTGLAEVSVQGSHEKAVEEILVKQYGLKSSWIDVTDKLKKQRRK
ncbi:hypothetical protein FOA43_002871 [Brettanomyces nanus]|uniref:SUI1 domain-containing protein n=1 Tax=Eeniella nana TaxID=13502 RepID=A0A875S2E5_EENNA|nr:uncharacterized protein FOA43_002871 [Brettanomyces nanus]QPG75516.1 hypothetical protein FOA43_002871 [Brettanomyces nanus]